MVSKYDMRDLLSDVKQSTLQFGDSVKTARVRRRLSQRDVANTMGVSLGTVRRIERGDPGVSLQNVVLALHVLNLLPGLLRAIDPESDAAGIAAEAKCRPKRIRSRLVPDAKHHKRTKESAHTDDRLIF